MSREWVAAEPVASKAGNTGNRESCLKFGSSTGDDNLGLTP
jgi:hypothetical protein